MEGFTVADSEIQDVETSPKDQLVGELNALKEASIKGVAVEDFGDEFIESLNECEVAMALAGVRTAPLVNQIYTAYLTMPYVNWPTFWRDNRDHVREIAAIYLNAADLIPADPDYAPYKEYLEAIGIEWFWGEGRAKSEAEMLWYNLSWEHCRIDLRSSPKLEEGHEAYNKSEREDGGTASLTLRQVIRMLGSEDQSEIGRYVDRGISEVLNAYGEYPDSQVSSRADNVLIRAAMHGSSRATAHQYKRERDGAPTLVRYILNLNLQARNKEEFLERLPKYFTPELADEMRRIVAEDVPELRFGHEVAETRIESMFKARLAEIGSREGIELLSTLVAIEGVRRQIREEGDICDVFYDRMMKRFIAGYYDLISRPFDQKLLPYLRGDDFAMERLREHGALVFEGKALAKINRSEFEKAVAEMVDELLIIISTGNKDAHDERLK